MVVLSVVAMATVVVLCVVYLRSPGPQQPRDGDGSPRKRAAPVETTLGVALRTRDVDAVRRLLDDDADPNAAALDDLPPLHAIVSYGAPEMIGPLCDAGAALDHSDARLGGAVAFAVALGRPTIAMALLDAGVSVEPANDGGAHALHMAALRDDVRLIRRLVAAGIEVDRRNFAGGTALRSAASAGKRDAVAALLSSGANGSVVDAMGKSPREYAEEGGHETTAALLPAVASTDAWRGREDAPLAMLLPKRTDATLGVIRQALEHEIEMVEVASSSLEAPSVILSIRRVLGSTFSVGTSAEDEPDPRKAIRDVRWALWTYPNDGTEPLPALPAPDSETTELVRSLALRPYRLEGWCQFAQELAADLGVESIGSLLATMARPPKGPSYLEAWDWWFRAQVASALIVSFVGADSWGASERRAALRDVLDGPADWSNTAVVVALFDVARRDADARGDVVDTLLAVTRRTITSPAYQHAIRPAALALLELGGLPPETEATIHDLIEEP